MKRIENTIFISYRRKDVSWALTVYQDLTHKGYDVFFDYTSIPSGDFEQSIISNIKARAHFVMILTPTTFDRCSEPGDWLRREIETAIDEQRNIVPLFFDGFNFGAKNVSEKLTGKLKNVSNYNGMNVHHDYFEAAMERLRTQFLNVPLNAVLHPVSAEVREVVKGEQLAANKAILHSSPEKPVIQQKPIIKTQKPEEITTKEKIIPAEKAKTSSQRTPVGPISKLTRDISTISKNRPLRVLLCHSSNDKPIVRELYQKLRAELWIQPWLDEEELYPGQDWNMEIEKAVEAADVIIVCLTKGSITKEGYVQRELRIVLDFADYKPEGTLYIIPVRLEECEPPRRLRTWQYADYFEGQRERALQRLLVSLKKRADLLELKISTSAPDKEESVEEWISPENKVNHPIKKAKKLSQKKFVSEILLSQMDSKSIEEKTPVATISKSTQPVTPPNKITLSNGMEFMRVPAGNFIMGGAHGENNEKPQHTVNIPYDYWMARFPVTNEQYSLYRDFDYFKSQAKGWEQRRDHPVVVSYWHVSMGYCYWLNESLTSDLPKGFVLRLPTEAEWEKAARGTDGRNYPWGNKFDSQKCNAFSGNKLINQLAYFGLRNTTSVYKFSPDGDSPYGCADMVGNVWEWTHSLIAEYPYKANDGREDEKELDRRVLRGGSYVHGEKSARCCSRAFFDTDIFQFALYGIRLAISLSIPDIIKL